MKSSEINISPSFQALLEHLFGTRYHQFSGLIDISEWKKVLFKIVKNIQKSIDYTIEVTDFKHKERLNIECNLLIDYIKKAKTIDQLNEKAILGLINLVFYLIGDRPNHLNMESTSHPKHWKLNNKRQVIYIQSNEQKFKMIIENADSEDINNSNGYNKNYLYRIFNKMNRDYYKFLEWHKNEHQIMHNKLF